jgi:predicted transcriptional regulator
MSTKEAQERIVENMKKWQKVENAAISSTGRVIEKTENPIVRTVMEIIQRDSAMHHRVQEMIADSLTTKPITLTPEEVGAVWDLIDKHIELEKQTIELAKQSLSDIEGKKGMIVQRYLLEYLLRDEEKHDAILANLQSIKRNMYPYG